MSRIKDALPFHVFARRRQVLGLFRSMLKAAKQVQDPSVGASLSREISAGFRQNSDLRDPVAVKTTLQEANRYLKQLQAMGPDSDMYDGDSWINQSTPDDERGRVGTGFPWQK